MKIYAIGDMHLSSNSNKPMDIFGWVDHKEKIFENWNDVVTEDDLVIIAGDTSWALHLEDSKEDLGDISRLAGKKILIKGNHDYWWSTLSKMNGLFEDMIFLHNTAYVSDDIGICGTRGWICPNDQKFTDKDRKIYEREADRLHRSLENAVSRGAKRIIAALHYPPTNEKFDESLFTQLFKQYKVEIAVYGHLHGEDSFKMGMQGMHDGTVYQLVSCDYLDFKLKRIV